MKIEKIKYGMRAFLLSMLFVLILLPDTASARVPIDLNQKNSLTIHFPCDNIPIQIYRVADVTEAGEYIRTEAFSDYNILLEQPDQTGWRNLAATISGYAERDGIKTLESGVTDEDGTIVFENLKAGLYLVSEGKGIKDGYEYTSEAFLVALPELGERDQWIADVNSTPKYTKDPLQPEGTTIQKKVLKIWDDAESKKRPQKIEVQLLKDGKITETVSLAKENNWKYQWDHLDASSTWKVVEKEVPSGYTVTINQDDSTFTITNKLNVPAETKPSKLPQTGQMWWPVGILTVTGMLVFLAGWIRRKNSHEEN